MVVADEHGVVLSYWMSEGESDEERPAFVRLLSPLMHMFGPPNDEALQGHPLWSRGLDYYGVFRVDQSSLVRGAMNRVHPRHTGSLFEGHNHYIFTFHDSTFECVAKSMKFEIVESLEEERHVRMHRLLWANQGRIPISTPGSGKASLRRKVVVGLGSQSIRTLSHTESQGGKRFAAA